MDALAIVGANGRIISSSRQWPALSADVSERDYFRALVLDASRKTLISGPIQNKVTGAWIVSLAQRLSAPNGAFAGLVIGTITLEHFEKFFQSISLQEGSAVALVRQDGTLFARYPRTEQVGRIIPLGSGRKNGSDLPVFHIDSPFDGQKRIVSVKPLASYPLAIAVSQTEASALKSWRNIADHSNAMALVRTFVVLAMALAASRWWQRQRTLTQQLRLQNLRFDSAVNNMSQGLCFFDGAQRLVMCNRRYLEMYGLDPERVHPGTTLREIVDLRFAAGSCPAMSREEYLAWRDRISVQDKPSDTTVELKDGRVFEISHRPMPDGGWVATHEDISERQRLNARLEQNLRLLGERTSLLQAVIDNFPGGIGFFDRDLRIVLCNERAKSMLDLPGELFADGPPLLEDVLRFNAARGEYGPGDAEQQVAEKLALAKNRTTYRFERARPDGTVLDVRGKPVDNGGFITTYMDITDRCRSEAKIAHMAHHDSLTGLANRVLLHERLARALAQARPGESVALHLIDLDRFKAVNDSLGHPVGDVLLRQVAGRLRPLLRSCDTIARMGGDEFAIVQAGVRSPGDAGSLAQRVVEAVRDPYQVDGHEVVIGASIGVALGPDHGADPAELIRNADLSLYEVKGSGRGGYRFFEAAMHERMQTRRAMEVDLRTALGRGELALYYQPLVNTESKQINGFEALIRWHHPREGTIPPDRFMPLAEETGLMIAIGEWTLREACATAAKWPSQLRVAVNLSPAQFRSPALPAAIVRALAASGLAAERLELEINEMALWEDMQAALDILYRLRGLGVRIALDDFGTGHSSLNFLQSFPFDRIKIDRSFVSDITESVGSLKIVRAVTTLAQGLGMNTTVEGVERADQVAAATAEGCTEMQGFLFGRPVPSQELDELLRSQCREAEPSQVTEAA